MRSAKEFLVHFVTSTMILSAFSQSSLTLTSIFRPKFNAVPLIIAE